MTGFGWFYGFQKSLRSNALDESSLSIGRVNLYNISLSNPLVNFKKKIKEFQEKKRKKNYPHVAPISGGKCKIRKYLKIIEHISMHRICTAIYLAV